MALAQISPTLGDVAANLELHRKAIQRAVDESAQLVVFPELSLTGYRLRDSVPDVALQVPDEALSELAALSTGVSIVAGFVEETSDHLFYNSAAYFEGGKIVSVHRKAYLPTYGMFDEQRYFARGRRIEAFDSGQGRLGMLICEEMLHPTAPTIVACDGATMLLVPAASPARGVTGEGETTIDANARSWESYNHVIARTYGLWVVYCNRVGVEDGVAFWGGSEIVSPAGETLVKAAYYDEDYASAVLPEDAVRRRRIVNPIVRDEDLDLTINELLRIRGRAAESAAHEKRAAADSDRGGAGDDDRGNRVNYRGQGDARGNRDDRRPRPGQGEGFRPYKDRRFDRGQGEGGDRPRFNRDDRGGDDRRGRSGDERGFGGGGGDRFGNKSFGKKPFGQRGRFGDKKFGGNRDDRREGSQGNFNREQGGGGFGGPPRDRGFPPRRDDDRGHGGQRQDHRQDRPDRGFGPPRARDGGDDKPKWQGRPRVGEDTTAPPPPRERQRPAPDERRPRPMRVKRERDE